MGSQPYRDNLRYKIMRDIEFSTVRFKKIVVDTFGLAEKHM